MNTVKNPRRSLTLEEYRKKVGIRVVHRKHNQHLGKANNGTTFEIKTESVSGAHETVTCPHCGLKTKLTQKCERCHQLLQFLNGPSKRSKNPAGVQTRQTSRLHKVRHESQCVTLSGGDYGNFSQVKKKLKHDKVLESKDSSFPQSVVKQEDLAESDEEISVISLEEREDETEIRRWKEGGFIEPFTAVSCRSIRIGSYKFCPPSRVLFSSDGITLEAPQFDPITKLAQNKWISIPIDIEQLSCVEISFESDLPVIFLSVAPKISRRISVRLGLDKNWDPASPEQSQKRLILFPISLDDSVKRALRQAFVPRGLLSEITYDYANDLLVKSLLPELRKPTNDTAPVHVKSFDESTRNTVLRPIFLRRVLNSSVKWLTDVRNK